MGCLVAQVLQLYIILVFARIILGLFPLQEGGAMAGIYGVLYSVTEPVLGPLRQLIPSIGMFDISPLVLSLIVSVVARSIC
ncbi:MAG TPA: YggT family protein [Acidimicrobiales bacterium]